MDRAAQTLLGLLRVSLGCGSEVPDLRSLFGKEWERLVDVSFESGVSALPVEEIMTDTIDGGINTKDEENFLLKCLRIARRFARIWHYRSLATESVSRIIWNNFAFSSYIKRKIEM